MRLVTLIENTACREGLTCEHGLSLYIEVDGLHILFDAGQTAAFADNAEALGVDLSTVDLCVLSHGHYDHGGGLRRFLEINQHAPVYLSRHAFDGHWHGAEKYIGLDRGLMTSDRLVFVDGETSIVPGLTLHTALPCPHGIETHGLQLAAGGALIPEDFRHEQYLLIREGTRRILISGCSHRGVLNIAEHFTPDVLIGGFHLMKVTDPMRLASIGKRLAGLPCTYYTGHCTGGDQFRTLQGVLAGRLQQLSTGSIHTI